MRRKKKRYAARDAALCLSITERAISSPSFVSAGRAGGRDFTSTRFAIPPASRNFHVYETAGGAQKIT